MGKSYRDGTSIGLGIAAIADCDADSGDGAYLMDHDANSDYRDVKFHFGHHVYRNIAKSNLFRNNRGKRGRTFKIYR